MQEKMVIRLQMRGFGGSGEGYRGMLEGSPQHPKTSLFLYVKHLNQKGPQHPNLGVEKKDPETAFRGFMIFRRFSPLFL